MMSINRFTKRLQYRKAWLSIGWMLIFAIIYLTLMPSPPELMDSISYGDKIGHLVAYAILMLWFCQLYLGIQHRLLLSLALILMGISLEFLQGLAGVRMYEIADMIANSTGVIIGAILTYAGLGNVLHNIEKKMGVIK